MADNWKPLPKEDSWQPIRDVTLPEAPDGSRAGDLWKSFKAGVEQLPGVATGLADIPFALAFNKRPISAAADAIGEATGFQPGKWAKEQDYSRAYRNSQAEVENAWADPNAKAADVARAYLTNPMYLANQTVQSAPAMLAGGAVSKGLGLIGRASPAVSDVAAAVGARPGVIARTVGEEWAAPVLGGMGEGAIQTGQAMDDYQGDDARKGAIAALGSGTLDMLIASGGGRLAHRLGLETPETAMAGGRTTGVESQASRARRVLGGMAIEGGVQEFPQSMQEQMWQNYADDKPLMDGVLRQGIEGGLAGAAMGGVFNLRRAKLPVDTKEPGTPATTDPLDLLTTSQGFEDLQRQPTAPASPLGDLTPNWTTQPGANTGPRYDGGIDPAGLTPALGDQEPNTGVSPLGSGLQMPLVPGRPGMSDTMLSGPTSEIAATDADNAAMQDPGTILAMRQYQEQKAKRDEEDRIKREAQAKHEATVAAVNATLFTQDELATQPKVPHQVLKAATDMNAAKESGLITPEQHGALVGELRAALAANDKGRVSGAVKSVNATLKDARKLADANAAMAQTTPNVPSQAPNNVKVVERKPTAPTKTDKVAATTSQAPAAATTTAPVVGKTGNDAAAAPAAASPAPAQSAAVSPDEETSAIWNDEMAPRNGPKFHELKPEVQSYLLQQDSIGKREIEYALASQASSMAIDKEEKTAKDAADHKAANTLDVPTVLEKIRKRAPKMQVALRAAIGIDETGLKTEPKSLTDAAAAAGYAKGGHGNVQRALGEIGVTPEAIARLHGLDTDKVFNNDAHLGGETPNVGDINANTDADAEGYIGSHKLLRGIADAENAEELLAALDNAKLAKILALSTRYNTDEAAASTTTERVNARRNKATIEAIFREGASRARNSAFTDMVNREMARSEKQREEEYDKQHAQADEGTEVDSQPAGEESLGGGETSVHDLSEESEGGSVQEAGDTRPAGPAPTVVVKKRRTIVKPDGGAKFSKSEPVTVEVNGSKLEFKDPAATLQTLQDKIDRHEALLKCLIG